VPGLDPTRVLKLPGRFVIGADLSADSYPYGGTPVGFTSRAKLVREQVYAYGNSEAYGRDKASTYGGRYSAIIVAVLEQFDPTVLNLLYASSGVSAGGFVGANVLSLPGPEKNLAPGLVTPPTALGAGNGELLFVADNVLGNPSIIVYAPSFILAPKLEAEMQLNKPLEHLFMAVVGMDATFRDLACDLLGNLAA
jgi:hypothetical protein